MGHAVAASGPSSGAGYRPWEVGRAGARSDAAWSGVQMDAESGAAATSTRMELAGLPDVRTEAPSAAWADRMGIHTWPAGAAEGVAGTCSVRVDRDPTVMRPRPANWIEACGRWAGRVDSGVRPP